MNSLFQDVRYAVRMLRKSPGFTTVALLAIALGVGANTAIFSFVNAVLLHRLPFRDESRLVMVFERNLKRELGSHGPGKNVAGPKNFFRWQERNQVFEQMGFFFGTAVNFTGEGEPERLPLGYVTANLFPMLGIQPTLGRNFTAEEDQPGRATVVIISDGLWERRFGGDPHVLGRKIQINGRDNTIVGVMPRNLALPSGMDAWAPFGLPPEARTAGGRWMLVVAKLKSGVTLQQAQGQMQQLASQIEKEDPAFDTGWNVNVVPLREQLVGDIRLPLLVLFGAVTFVLLICCANVANLLLARASDRAREIAIRLALGVSRRRVVQQLLTESLVLALLGGALGVVLAFWLLDALMALVPTEVPAFTVPTINGAVLAFTAGASLVTGILFGMAPALRLSRMQPVESLKEGGRGTIGGKHHLRNGLVVAEAAITLVLLVGAGLLMKSFVRLMQVDPGFRPDHLLTAQISRSERDNKKVINFYDQVLERVRALPGVTAAGAVSFLPLDGLGSATSFTLDDRAKPRPGDEPVADVRSISADYFKAMGTPLLLGRSFDPTLDQFGDRLKKVILNQSAAQQYWPGEDPIGKHLTMPWFEDMHAEVIGVIPDLKLLSLNTSSRSQLYWFLPQFPYAAMSLVIRTSGAPEQVVGGLRAAVREVDPKQPIAKVRAMDDVVAVSVKQPRFVMTLLAGFATLALLLAAVGIYGVMSYSVTQRTQEMGIRIALGAQPRDVARLVLGEGMRLAVAGVALGIVAALVLTRLLRTLLFEVRSTDPVTFAAVCGVLALIAAIAIFIPARRATRVDPMVTLRYE
jgi:putative ABC transport system permease protein